MDRQIYVVQTQVISLGGNPFLSKKEVKPPFHALFTSKKCFTELRTTILDSSRYQLEEKEEDTKANASPWLAPPSRLIPLHGNPFVPRLGQVCFNTRSAVFSDEEERSDLAVHLARRKRFWDPQAKASKKEFDWDLFAYDPQAEDQRMNMLYFELYKPLYFTASLNKRKMATARVFLHIYPCGYLVMQLAVRFTQNCIRSMQDYVKAIHETQLWKKNSSWEWKGRIAAGTLEQVLSEVHQLAVMGFLEPSQQGKVRKRNWYTSIRSFDDEWNMHQAAKPFFMNNINAVELRRLQDDGDHEDEYGRISETVEVRRGLVTAKEGLLLCLPSYYRRKKALGQFWKILRMAEFTLLRDQFYTDLANYLGSEIERLRDFRLDTKRKILQESLFSFSVYQSELPRFLSALDKHTRRATAFYRYIHSCVAEGIDHYQRRDKVKELLEEWITEVERWKPNLVVIWEKVITPLRTLLGLIK